jgi:hypothetical protein
MLGEHQIIYRFLRVILPSVSVLMAFFEHSGAASAAFSVPLQIIVLILALWMIYSMGRLNPAFILTSVYQIYAFIGLMVSAIFISAGSYMIEIDSFGTPNSVFWVCSLFLFVGLEAAYFGYRASGSLQRFAETRPKLHHQTSKALIGSICILIISSGCALLLIYKGPVLSDMTRVAFWQNFMPPILSKYPSILGQSFIFLALLYFMAKAKRQRLFIYRLAIIIYALLTIFLSGEKFSTFVILFVIWCCIAAGFGVRIRLSFRSVFILFSFLLALITLIVTSYVYDGRSASFIFDRIALQAELVWSVMNEPVETVLTGMEKFCFAGCVGFENGTDFISARYMRSGLYDVYLETGSGLTGFLPSLPILSFGIFLSLWLHAFVSIILGCIQRILVGSVVSLNVISTFLIFKVYFGVTVFWYAAKVYAVPGILLSALVIGLFWCLPTTQPRRLREV